MPRSEIMMMMMFYVPFNIIEAISRRCHYNERLCAMKCRTVIATDKTIKANNDKRILSLLQIEIMYYRTRINTLGSEERMRY